MGLLPRIQTLKDLVTWKGSVYKNTLFEVALWAFVGWLYVFIFRRYDLDYSENGYGLNAVTHGMAGGLLSFLLVGRYSSATDRWWNVKTTIDGVAGGIEGFTSTIYSYAAGKRELYRANRQLVRLLYGFFVAGVRSIGGDDAEVAIDLPLILSSSEMNAIRRYEGSKPNMLHAIVRRELFSRNSFEWWQRKEADRILNDVMGGLAKVGEYQGNRIPLPAVQMLNIAIFIYFATLPLVLMPVLKGAWGLYVMVPIAMAALAFMFYGVKNAAEEMEYPFGSDDNDVSTRAASKGLHKALRAVIALHEGQVPLAESPTFWLELCDIQDREMSAQAYSPIAGATSPVLSERGAWAYTKV